MRQAEKEKKKFYSRIPFILDPGKKIPKKIAKKFKKFKKPVSEIIFCQNGMRQAEKEKKKILLPNSVHTRLGQENSEKNSKKIEKTKKTSFRHYFQPKRDGTGREREKKIYFRIPFKPDSGKKIPKKIAKKLK